VRVLVPYFDLFWIRRWNHQVFVRFMGFIPFSSHFSIYFCVEISLFCHFYMYYTFSSIHSLICCCCVCVFHKIILYLFFHSRSSHLSIYLFHALIVTMRNFRRFIKSLGRKIKLIRTHIKYFSSLKRKWCLL
jgi:hypothetical protein